MSEEMEVGLGEEVGYSIRFEDVTSTVGGGRGTGCAVNLEVF